MIWNDLIPIGRDGSIRKYYDNYEGDVWTKQRVESPYAVIFEQQGVTDESVVACFGVAYARVDG